MFSKNLYTANVIAGADEYQDRQIDQNNSNGQGKQGPKKLTMGKRLKLMGRPLRNQCTLQLHALLLLNASRKIKHILGIIDMLEFFQSRVMSPVIPLLP